MNSATQQGTMGAHGDFAFLPGSEAVDAAAITRETALRAVNADDWPHWRTASRLVCLRVSPRASERQAIFNACRIISDVSANAWACSVNSARFSWAVSRG